MDELNDNKEADDKNRELAHEALHSEKQLVLTPPSFY